jgi:hypothetical protein
MEEKRESESPRMTSENGGHQGCIYMQEGYMMAVLQNYEQGQYV